MPCCPDLVDYLVGSTKYDTRTDVTLHAPIQCPPYEVRSTYVRVRVHVRYENECEVMRLWIAKGLSLLCQHHYRSPLLSQEACKSTLIERGRYLLTASSCSKTRRASSHPAGSLSSCGKSLARHILVSPRHRSPTQTSTPLPTPPHVWFSPSFPSTKRKLTSP